jgi:hypothetical protein
MIRKKPNIIKIWFASVFFLIGWVLYIYGEPIIKINGKAYKLVKYNDNISKL